MKEVTMFDAKVRAFADCAWTNYSTTGAKAYGNPEAAIDEAGRLASDKMDAHEMAEGEKLFRRMIQEAK